MNWNDRKIEVLNDIASANITDSDAIKLILFVERKMNSAHNALQRGSSFSATANKYSCLKWIDAMTQLGNAEYWNSYDGEAPYFLQWLQYCDVTGYATSFGMGDAIC
jgi:hypothetical protein